MAQLKMNHPDGWEWDFVCQRFSACKNFPKRCWNCVHGGSIIANMNCYKEMEDGRGDGSPPTPR